jgi:ribosome-binding factor A
MSHDYARAERVGAEMRRLLAILVHDELRDPRVGMVTVQEVRVSRDLAHARVYYTCMDESKIAESGRALQHSAGFLRARLGKLMRLRTIPELDFTFDKSVAYGTALTALIDRTVSDDESKHGGGAD